MKDTSIKFDFNDILIVPKKNVHINSRYLDIILPQKLPLFTAPMNTVVNLDNLEFFLNNRINVTLPRTITYEEFSAVLNKKTLLQHRIINDEMFFPIKKEKSLGYNKIPLTTLTIASTFVSLGFKDLDRYYLDNFKNFHEGARILIDVANGHMQKIIDYCREIKRLRPDVIIMVGNIGNPESYWWYAQNDCVDFIRIGIGNGNGCLTTKQSGIGYPMASLIHETYLQKQEFIKHNNIDIKHKNSILNTNPVKTIPAIIADGGTKDYSDIIKALALGADYVMSGSIFNKAFESCANNYLYGIKLKNKTAGYFFDKGFPIKKYYSGMSTKAAQKAMGKTNFRTSEGVIRFRCVEYHLSGWVENFQHYLRNAMSYVDAKTLDDFIGKVDISRITQNAYDRFNK